MLLAIDTSTDLTGLAGYDESGLLSECVWLSGRNHTAQLLPQLQMLMHNLNRGSTDLQAVAVALGPGSWSGLRVGMSVAKGLAFAGGLALIGIGTLDMLAYQYQHATMSVYPLIHLGRDRFATAAFHSTGLQWQRASHYRNVSLAELCTEISSKTLFCGSVDPDVRSHLRRELGEQACFPREGSASMRRPGYLAELAWKRFRAGDLDDLARLEPIYLGQPVKEPAQG